MTRYLRLGGAILGFVLIPVMAVAQKVNYDFDRTRDFTQLKTFALKQSAQSENPLVDKRVVYALVRNLAARGMHEVTRES